MSSNYKDTLCLPKTSFPMKANLRAKEPEMLEFWARINAYEAMVQASPADSRYVLHDGPPYANGHIHLGTALNKILKDIVVKSANMRGQRAEYVPGWDCHGLPIEHKVAQEIKKEKLDLNTLQIRQRCREYAETYLDIQREEFKRLGVFGVWDDPYMTMKPAYESATASELGEFMSTGSAYRGKKPVHWCCSCKTALAEAEVEYYDASSPSIFVRFPLPDEKFAKLLPPEAAEKAANAPAYAVIWTTTPWTIPDNMAVAAHPEFEYSIVLAGGGVYVVASQLLPTLVDRFHWADREVLAEVPGSALEGLEARHPFYDRPSPIVLADYVTLDAGTGLVHTAPGHGREDFETGVRCGLDIYSPMDDEGRFLPSVEHFAGMNVTEANPEVIKLLTEKGHLLAQEKISHSYPHCWRCKQPVIFRATTQWFISMETNGLRKRALDAINNEVRWIPSWGRERIHSMIENRPDWCISRQRNWGVPIIALICKDCDTAYHDGEWVKSVAARFKDHPLGCDAWFEADVKDIMPEGLVCPKCGGTNFVKEDDILDVWFDSGTSFSAVVEQRPECAFPADLYLEGSDQHRGWFHSSLLASIGTRGVPPYRAVLTHGYVVDGEGRKMSKSIGNVIAPQQIIDKHGAEILRLWVSAVNYQEDVRISDEILTRLVDAYRRIRNTARFLLGNLADFDPAADCVDFGEMNPIDRYYADLLLRRRETMVNAFSSFEFHKVHHTLHNLCVTDLSAFYLDIVKDRLYVEDRDGAPRRAAQTVLWIALQTMLEAMAPILSFTAEEIFQHLADPLRAAMAAADAATVFGVRPSLPAPFLEKAERDRFESILAVRAEANRAAEPVRKRGDVGKSLDCSLTIQAPEELLDALRMDGLDLEELFIVSKLELRGQDHKEALPNELVSDEIEGLRIGVAPAVGDKCERCWRIDEHVGKAGREGVCPRCAGVLERLPS
ncbi:MAG: isoleucyl-tRNA synthetase [Desulfovibrionales bacterium]|nr:isoleucyl-tRNA synthetase [Desulfovibrionales bacterium]